MDAWERDRADLEGRVAARITKAHAPRKPHPAPTVPCRLAEEGEVRGGALALQRAVQRAGGRVQVTYAQGYPIHSVTGRPLALRDSIAVRCWGPDGQRLVAVWTRPIGGAWTCGCRVAWGSKRTIGRLTDEEMKTEVASWGGIGIS